MKVCKKWTQNVKQIKILSLLLLYPSADALCDAPRIRNAHNITNHKNPPTVIQWFNQNPPIVIQWFNQTFASHLKAHQTLLTVTRQHWLSLTNSESEANSNNNIYETEQACLTILLIQQPDRILLKRQDIIWVFKYISIKSIVY